MAQPNKGATAAPGPLNPQDALEGMGIRLPPPPPAAGSYLPLVSAGGLAFVSGQIPARGGAVEFAGPVSDSNIDEGRKSARLCALNALSQIKAGVGLGRVERVVRLSCYVACGPGFTRHPEVANAASDLFAEVFGEHGKHSRVAVGVASLPLGAMTELDAVVQLRP